MQHFFLRTFVVATLVALLLGACGRDRRRGGGGPDDGPGPGTDGGGVDSSTITPPGELSLAVESATWAGSTSSGRDLLEVRVRLGNGTGADPASLAPMLFSAQTTTGTEVLGGTELVGAEECSADLAVSADASRACALSFAIPMGEMPTIVIYRGSDGREATAAIPACSASVPDGLCTVGTSCVEGSCDASECTQFTLEGEGCVECVSALGESDICGSLTGTTCPDVETCALCPFDSGADTCTCLSDPACEGCETTATDAWDCIAAECPSCVL